MRQHSNLFLLLILTLFAISGCKDKCDSPNLDVDQEQLAVDIVKIDAYLETQRTKLEADGYTIKTHPSGLRYVIKRKGDGDEIEACDNVVVTYEGRVIGNSNTFGSQETPRSLGELSGLIVG